jgi:hypothetical protein
MEHFKISTLGVLEMFLMANFEKILDTEHASIRGSTEKSCNAFGIRAFVKVGRRKMLKLSLQ